MSNVVDFTEYRTRKNRREAFEFMRRLAPRFLDVPRFDSKSLYKDFISEYRLVRSKTTAQDRA